MINNNISYYLTHLPGEGTTGVNCTVFAVHGCVATPWNGMAPRNVARGAREAGIGQCRGCRDRVSHASGRPHPASGSHLPAEGTAPPCAVAFRVVAPCPAPPKPYTSPRPTTGFRLKKRFCLNEVRCQPFRNSFNRKFIMMRRKT